MNEMLLAVTSLSDAVTADMLKGIFNEVLKLVPIILPVSIGFLAFRKGWSFLKGEVHSA